MHTDIKKVAVIGAGVMGAAIAAHVANAGIPALLLDIPAEGANRDAIAEGAVARMLKTDPAPLMSPRNAKLIETGNTEDDLGKLADCDWIIEAVVERLDIKQSLYRRIEGVRRPGTVVSSNTSTIPLRALTEGLPDTFQRAFLITHFFNPPRYMRLLELIPGPDTDPALTDRVSAFCDMALGKSVVRCKDTPGFIGNRLGVYWLQCAVNEAFDTGITVEEADAIIGKPMGIPKTGVFALLDLVGLDLMPHVNASMAKALPAGDPFHATNRPQPLITRMIAEGYTGRKGKGGFFRINKAEGKRKEAIDLSTGEYRPATRPTPTEARAKTLRDLLAADGKLARYAWRVMGPTLSYAASLIPEAAADIVSIDEAMRLGYGWRWGPFELIDQIGAAALAERLERDDLPVPPLLRDIGDNSFYRVENTRLQFWTPTGYRDVPRAPGVLLLEDIKRATKPVAKNASAALWDIGDGVACFEFTSKSNSLDDFTLAMLEQSIGLVRDRFRALVIYNEGRNFSVGANIGLMLFAANMAAWSEITRLTELGQRVYAALRHAPFPVVAAPSGMALGGGCEILLHSDAIQAHAETYAGLVEAGVGLLPAWGGCKEMLRRWQRNPATPKGPMPAVAKVFEMVSTARVAKSAAEAKDMLILRPDDGITMNRNRLLADAKSRALALAETYTPPDPATLTLPGPSGKLALLGAAQDFHRRGLATTHDLTVATELAEVLTGGDADPTDPVPEQAILDLERKHFLRLAKTAPTLERIAHTLETGKPLRN